MSTFGKKSLIWWNYHDRDRATLLRFNSTPKEFDANEFLSNLELYGASNEKKKDDDDEIKIKV